MVVETTRSSEVFYPKEGEKVEMSLLTYLGYPMIYHYVSVLVSPSAI